jgi:preprotein translocase subunit SecA
VVNTIFDNSTSIVELYVDNMDYEGFKLELFRTFAMESPFSENTFRETKPKQLTENLFDEALKLFKRRIDRMIQVANPVIKQVYEQQGAMYENILIPITDGKRMYNITCNLNEAYETESKAIAKAFQKSIVLHTIDEAWKEHLRELDELRHSVQNASYENKDPLLIYKLESYNLFKSMVDVMNRKTAGILMRGQIPVREETPGQTGSGRRVAVQQAAQEKRQDMSRYRTEKSDIIGGSSTATPNAQRPPTGSQPPQPQMPIRAEKRVGRNDPCPCGSGKKYKNCHGKGL